MYKYIYILICLLGVALGASAQGYRYQNVIQGPRGPLANVPVAVCSQPATISSAPCSPLATLYTDSTDTVACNGTNGCSNPLTSDGYGNVLFYAAPGKYTIQYYGPQFSAPIAYQDIVLPCDPSNCSLTGTVTLPGLILNGSTITASEPVVTPTLNNVITPLQYGAKCDGSTDDSTSLQNTINAAQTISSATGAVIYIPPGKMCVFGTTLNIAGGTLNGTAPGLRIVGAGPKQTQLVGGSGLEYTGTGNGFVIEGSLGTSDFSYFISMQNLYFKATTVATSIIRAYNLNGPADFTGDIFDASNTAVNAITCSSNCGIQINVHDDLFFGFTGNELDFRGAGPFSVKDNQFFSSPVGVYLSAMAVATVADNYFELHTDDIEIGNDTAEAWGSYDIHGNTMNSGTSHTSPQRCLLVSSTDNSFPFYAQGSFKNNFCNLSNGFAQGLATYNVEFNTSANAFAVSQTWEVENNTFLGAVTSAIHNDNANVNVALKDNTSLQYYSVASPAPALALTSGSGLFNPICLSTSCMLKQNASPSNPSSGYDLLNFDTSDNFKPVTSAGAVAGGSFGKLTAEGTVAALTGTGACATNSTQKGGAWAGQATCTGTTGASTFIITPGTTAPNGWSCTASDLTTAANILRQSAVSTTACTIAGTVNANDVLTFTAVAY